MAKDKEGLLMHILPGWVFHQQIQCTLAYIIKFTGEINLVFTCDVTLYVHENFHLGCFTQNYRDKN